MSEKSLITLHFIEDDFIHSFLETSTKKKSKYYKKHVPKQRMPIADVIMLNIARIFDRTRDHKTFHKNTKKHNISYFPNLTNYENFLKATNKSIWFVMAFVHYNLYLNKLHCSKNVFYVNSMSITVCKNRYISSHKVLKGFANREEINKSMFFFGFKLQGIYTTDGTLLKLSFRPRKEHDSWSFAAVT